MGKYTKKTKNFNKVLVTFLVLLALGLAVLVAALFAAEKSADSDLPGMETDIQIEQEETLDTEPTLLEDIPAMPWDEVGAKQPVDYAWEEYEGLNSEQKKAFQAYLGVDAYTAWLNSMREHADVKPWDEPGAKLPEAYTWEDFEGLSSAQQIAFQNYLGVDAFSAWLTGVQRETTPWDAAGTKQPADYTWEEFEALTVAQQMLFQYDLGVEGFDKWLEQVQIQSESNPWNAAGAKQPEDYSWWEFNALTAAQQIAFQNDMGTSRFEKWYDRVQNQSVTNPWERSGAKQPENYTWKEFEALTATQQIAFQNYLGAERFSQWMDNAQTQSETNPWDKVGAKQPADYTWKEFEALTAAQQMAFQKALGTEGFESWLNQAQSQSVTNPWEKPGAKQPEDYTWEAFEALPPEQQMAFQNFLGEEAFENWLNQAQSQSEANPWEKPGAKQPVDYTWAEFEALTGAQQMAFQNELGPDGFESWLNQAESQ